VARKTAATLSVRIVRRSTPRVWIGRPRGGRGADHRQILELDLGGTGDHCAEVAGIEMLHGDDDRRAWDELPRSAFPHGRGDSQEGEGESIYDRIGRGYGTARGEDPRIAAAIERGLGAARSVVNVGAGTGSYEPRDCEVTAVEPSAVMIAQRPAGRAPVIQAAAEALPLADDSFAAAMAIFTDHHWEDRAAGIGELRRVARDRVVMVNADPALIGDFWLARDYLPAFARIAPEPYREPGYWEAELRGLLGEVEIEPIPISADCRDGFCGAWWRRPEAYFDASVRAGISVFQVLPEEEVRAGLERLRADLDDGTWARRNAELLAREETDLGIRLVVARL